MTELDYAKEQKLKRKLEKISKDLNNLLVEIKQYYPDANYMVSGYAIHVIGEAYRGGESCSENGVIMSSGAIECFDSGDWD